jgi:hypothetical protein
VPHGVGPPIRHKNPNFERNDGSSERLGERHADRRAASMRTLFSACISRFSLCFRYSGGLVKIELTRAAPTSLYVSPSQFVNRVAGPGFVAIVPPKTLLLVKAISDGKGHCRRLPIAGRYGSGRERETRGWPICLSRRRQRSISIGEPMRCSKCLAGTKRDDLRGPLRPCRVKKYLQVYTGHSWQSDLGTLLSDSHCGLAGRCRHVHPGRAVAALRACFSEKPSSERMEFRVCQSSDGVISLSSVWTQPASCSCTWLVFAGRFAISIGRPCAPRPSVLKRCARFPRS